jgi:cold shock CspA family protein
LQTVVKKWFRDKEYGFLDNGSGPDIMVRKSELVRCQFLKPGASVEFECHPDNGGLIAKNVRLMRENAGGQRSNGKGKKNDRPKFIGVMS